jgi:hypothetical protein
MRQTVTGYEATPPVVDRASRLIVCTCQRMSPRVCVVSSRRAWEPLAWREVVVYWQHLEQENGSPPHGAAMSNMTALALPLVLPYSLIISWQPSVFALSVLICLANTAFPNERKYNPVPETILPGRPGLLGLTFCLYLFLYSYKFPNGKTHQFLWRSQNCEMWLLTLSL